MVPTRWTEVGSGAFGRARAARRLGGRTEWGGGRTGAATAAAPHPLPAEAPPPPPPSLDTLPTPPDETAPARVPFHRRLAAAAAAGDRDAADAVLADMGAAGLPPGPRAVHAAVVAAARAGDADGALDAMRAAHARGEGWCGGGARGRMGAGGRLRPPPPGLRPLAASYVALIIAFTTVRDAAAARAVLASMQRAADDARPGWLALCAGLFAAGLGADAAAALERGARDGWLPDADLYAAYLDWLVATPAGAARARSVFADGMRRARVPPDVRHANALIYADVTHIAPHVGADTLRAAAAGELGAGCRPNAATYAIVAEGHLAAIDAGSDTAAASHDALDELLGTMLRAGLRPDKRAYACVARARLATGRVPAAAAAFRRMAALAAPGARTALLGDEALAALARALAATMRPIDLLDVLAAAADDGRTLPESALAPDPALGGHTLAGAWLPPALAAARAARKVSGLVDESGVGTPDDDAGDRSVDGVLVDADGAAIWEVGGAPIPVSRMSREELTAELVARGLPTDGLKSEQYRRVQAARGAARPDVASAARDRVAAAAAAAAREAATVAARVDTVSKADADVEWEIETWKDGVVVSREKYWAPPPWGAADADAAAPGGARAMPSPTSLDGDDDDDLLDYTSRQVGGGEGGRGGKGGAPVCARAADPFSFPRQVTDRALSRAAARASTLTSSDDDGDDDGEGDADGDGDDDAARGPWLPPDHRVADLALGILVATEACGGRPSPPDLASLARAAAADGDGPLAAAVAARLTPDAVADLGARAAATVEADLLRAVSRSGRGEGARPAVLAGLDAAGLGAAAAAVDAALAAVAAASAAEEAAAASVAAAARASPPPPSLGDDEGDDGFGDE